MPLPSNVLSQFTVDELVSASEVRRLVRSQEEGGAVRQRSARFLGQPAHRPIGRRVHGHPFAAAAMVTVRDLAAIASIDCASERLALG